ncbi:MAG TPA: hypothetical protein VFB76_12210 [Candidatus Angelobacter sp.]|nr:hypothetical protein [Candidatus Angelobacter sp.]
MDNSTNSSVLFQEEQHVWRPWLAVFFVPPAFAACNLSFGVWQQVVRGTPWGHRPMSDALLVLVTIVTFLVPGATLWLLYNMRLTTVVDQKGIEVHFWPVRRRRILFAEIRSVAARDYSPILEYGGWGLRFGSKGWAYNARGKRGVQLELSKGFPVLIGSQHADELAVAIEKAKAE